MNFVVAIIKPFKLDDVKTAVTAVGVEGMTVSEVKGFGHQQADTEIFRGTEYKPDFVPKIKIEIVVGDDKLNEVVTAIIRSARSGKIGDGKIFVSTIQEAVRIRSNERNEAAIHTELVAA